MAEGSECHVFDPLLRPRWGVGNRANCDRSSTKREGSPLVWQASNAPLQATGCNIVWLNSDVRPAPREWLKAVNDQPILTLSNYADFTGKKFDIIINATSASLSGELPALPSGVFAAGSLAYDMMYGNELTPFLQLAQREGTAYLSDGTGMLVEQAAESFFLWRGVRPETDAVIKMLKPD